MLCVKKKNHVDIYSCDGQNFRDCFQTVRIEFSELFPDSPDRIFEIVFGQFGTDFRTVCVLFFFLCIIAKI